jgi:hypothetical protein
MTMKAKSLIYVKSIPTAPDHILAARFLTRRPVNLDAIARTFRPLWRTDNDFQLQDMGDNIVIIRFSDPADLERVIASGPWTYDKSLILFQRSEEGVPATSMVFDKADLWVQIHGLPPHLLDSATAHQIGGTIGKVCQESDEEEEMGWGELVRVRVTIDVHKPLCRGRKIGIGDNKEILVSFKYEKLPNFCYWCGLITHCDKDCSFWLRNRDTLEASKQQYGAWLRAPPGLPHRRKTVSVKGQVFRSQRASTSSADNFPTGKPDAAKSCPQKETDLGGDHEPHDLMPNSSPFDPLIPQKNPPDAIITEADFTSDLHAEIHVPNQVSISPAHTISPLEDPMRLHYSSFSGSGLTLKDITNVMGPNTSNSLGKSWKRIDRPRQGNPESPSKNPTKKRAGQNENQAISVVMKKNKVTEKEGFNASNEQAVAGFQHRLPQ